MSDFKALVFALDTTPNDGDRSARPLSRVFAFSTSFPLGEIERPDAIKASEMKNVQVGETIQIHGPGYIRVYTLAGKPNGCVELRRIGTENGPDPFVSGFVEIQPGEVFVHIPYAGLRADAQVFVTSKNCDVPYWVTISDDGFDIDVKTADVTPILFSWQVRL